MLLEEKKKKVFEHIHSIVENNKSKYLDFMLEEKEIEICNKVQSMEITFGKNGDVEDKTIVNVSISFNNFNKSISYKLENIY